MIAYKLFRPDMTTHNGFKWGVGETETIKFEGNDLCSNQVFHAYRSAKLAVLMNPIHANYDPALLYMVDVSEPVADDGAKIGVKTCTPIRQVEMPKLTTDQRIMFALLAEKSVRHFRPPIPIFDVWADTYLAGSKQTSEAGWAAWASEAAWAAWASEAAWVAWVAEAAWAAKAVAKAAEAAAKAAKAAWAAEAAAKAIDKTINLADIAEKI